MRKKLGTRFPASRIKKIMQADEDIGKIALAVPLLVSKALELFLQDLCDRTYEITLQRGAKTVNSLHLKQCVKTYSAFDFLTDVVNKVPNLGGTEPGGDERGTSRRRKTFLHDEHGETNEDLRSAKTAMRSANISPRGCGRGRGRGRGRPPTRMVADDMRYVKYEDDHSMSPEHGEPAIGKMEGIKGGNGKEIIGQNGHGNTPSDTTTTVTAPVVTPAIRSKQEEYPSWHLPGVMGDIGIQPSSLVHAAMKIDEDEDYDNED